MRKQLKQGTLSISENVIDFILDVAVKETEGVELISSPVKHTLKRMIRKGRTSVVMQDEEEFNLSLRVEVAITFGENIPYTCLMLQERIKNDVEKITGLDVYEVNLLVTGLLLKEEVEKI
ncbi:Asp23/Gls24 family envelope stress response protein [Pseudalkalibacillus hwajinpoensis]|uniref:Asp23/Gls24 family envelope stress response protein n=1 Tax=Guptibacillus hwajinpoensis TaxID=208199 RepID=UPI00325B3D11